MTIENVAKASGGIFSSCLAFSSEKGETFYVGSKLQLFFLRFMLRMNIKFLRHNKENVSVFTPGKCFAKD